MFIAHFADLKSFLNINMYKTLLKINLYDLIFLYIINVIFPFYSGFIRRHKVIYPCHCKFSKCIKFLHKPLEKTFPSLLLSRLFSFPAAKEHTSTLCQALLDWVYTETNFRRRTTLLNVICLMQTSKWDAMLELSQIYLSRLQVYIDIQFT